MEKVSLLRLGSSLRGRSPHSRMSCTFSGAAVDNKEQRRESRNISTFSSSFTKRFRTRESDNNEKSEGQLEAHTPLIGKKEKMRISFSALGDKVPLKISEMNKYLTDSSRRLIKSQSVMEQNKKNDDNTYTNKRDGPVDDLETSIARTNQSIISFYDSSYSSGSQSSATLQVSQATGSQTTSQDLNDDDSSTADIPQTIGPLFPKSTTTEAKKKKAAARRAEKISRLSLESRTKALVHSLKSAHSVMSKITRTEELCNHLIAHPECVWEASEEKVIPVLKSMTQSHDKTLRGFAFEALALLGFVKPLTSPGIRILSIDGGGTRGLVIIEFLKALEKESGRKIHEMFDYVCGVSTGALLATLVCLYKIPLDRCEELYKECSVQMFTRNRVVGTTKLVWNYGFYDSQSWEELLQKEMGDKTLIEFSRDPETPRMSAVSSLVSSQRMSNHLFRTYNPPPGVTSQYPGNCRQKVWQVIRASSAAPGYFASFTLGDEVHEDGGLLTNNPTALAIHESRLLWPTENFHCVVSLGTGRFENVNEAPAKVSLKRRLSTIVDSATDTEAVHRTLQDLLPARSYFRFNPYLSEDFFLDEIRSDKMAQMQHDSQMYTRRNSYKLTAASERLSEKRKPQQVVGDWFKKAVSQI